MVGCVEGDEDLIVGEFVESSVMVQDPLKQTPVGFELHGVPSALSIGGGQLPPSLHAAPIKQSFGAGHSQKLLSFFVLNTQKPSGPGSFGSVE